ncbi:isotrichodermin C-15 hydroxylase [Xylariaceae sp. FL1272]|nr:isotrichodermin C-15 hydroxylase [Xylariaceae sp. FL1272]
MASSHMGSYVLIAIGSVIAWQLATIIRNLYFHSLSRFPGPFIQRASGIPFALQHCTGVQPFNTQKLHDIYGPVVRIGPDHLSFTDPKAWKDIYGHRVGGDIHNSENPKDRTFNNSIKNIPTQILNADREEHSRFRRTLSHGFSDASMRAQESEIVKYVDLLVKRLHEECHDGTEKLNIEAWYNWTTFDIIGNLVFGQSFNCLENVHYHPWIEFILKTVRLGSFAVSLTYVGLSEVVQMLYRMNGSAIKRTQGLTRDLVVSRLSMDTPRNDLFEGLVKKREEWNLSFEKLSSNAFLLVLAGSETTATTLSGATYLLLTHPEILEKLQIEVRSSFTESHEITINTVSKLPYMLAILNEALRMYPPVTSGLVRKAPKGGATIAGHYVPEGTRFEIQQWSMNHSPENWADPWAFRPERFLGTNEEAMQAGNKLEALQAFSVGPRNCIGRNLAYAEMRIILARIIFDFDLVLSEESKQWIDKQHAYTLWERVPLNVFAKPIRPAKK